MQESPLVGQTFLLSPRNNETGGNEIQAREILRQFYKDRIRYYEVKNPATGEIFSAIANTYDQLFLTHRQPFKRKFTKGDSCYNQASINYTIKN